MRLSVPLSFLAAATAAALDPPDVLRLASPEDREEGKREEEGLEGPALLPLAEDLEGAGALAAGGSVGVPLVEGLVGAFGLLEGEGMRGDEGCRVEGRWGGALA
jgi:hypothetical protein